MDSNSKKNFWDLKPFWCQPWSIISFGILVLFLSWIFLNNIIFTSITAIIIIIWWILFLILVPNIYQSKLDENNYN